MNNPFKQTDEQKQKNTLLYKDKAVAFFNDGNLDDALKCINKVDPQFYQEFYHSKAGILYKSGKIVEADLLVQKGMEAVDYEDQIRLCELRVTMFVGKAHPDWVDRDGRDEANHFAKIFMQNMEVCLDECDNMLEYIKLIDINEPNDLSVFEATIENLRYEQKDLIVHLDAMNKRVDKEEYDASIASAMINEEPEWKQAEDLVGKLFEKKGYDVTVGVSTLNGGIKRNGDFGIDVRAKNDEHYLGIQVKHWNSNVDFDDVAKTLGVAQKYNKVIIISTKSGFTPQALQHASDNSYLIELWDRVRFAQELKDHSLNMY
jgi:hypothetical protein